MISLQEQIKGAALVVGVLAGASYVILRTVYVQFYAVFNLRPEDVGLGQTQFFSQALAGPALVVVLAALIIVLVVMAAMTYGVIHEGLVRDCSRLVGAARSEHSGSELAQEVDRRRGWVSEFTRRRLLDHWKGIGAISLLLGAVVVIAVLLVSARDTASQVRFDGKAVSNVSLDYGGFSLPLLDFRALKVTLHPRADEVPDTAGIDDCSLLLGATSNRLVVFNVRDARTYLVPSDGFLIELEARDLTPDCLPERGTAAARSDAVAEGGAT